MSSVLVTGSETGPKAEIQPYTEGRSTFYARSETFKLVSSRASDARVNAPPKSPPHPTQESKDDSLEQFRASIISQDVEQIQVSCMYMYS